MEKDYLKLKYALDFTLRCDACNDTISRTYCKADKALEYFYDKGWRVLNKEILCPKCVGLEESLEQTRRQLKEVKAQFESFKSELAPA